MADRLETLHRKIDDLTDPDGDYAVVCSLSGKRPVPVRGKSFPSPGAAADAVDLVVEYRTLLRDVDPYLENIPIVACEEIADPLSLDVSEERAARERASRDCNRRDAHSRDANSRDGRAPNENARNESAPDESAPDESAPNENARGETSRESTSRGRPASGRGRPRGRTGSRGNGRDPSTSVTLSGDGDDEWLRLSGAPVVRVREDGEPLDDAVIGLELNAKL